MAIIKVEFKFINKNGVEKNVHFFMDEKKYNAYHDPSVPKELTQEKMIDEYHEYCKEQKYRRMYTQFPVDDEGREIDIPDNTPSIADQMIELECKEKIRAIVDETLKKLTPKQREAFIKVHFEDKKSSDASKEMGINKSTFSEHLKKAELSFEKIINKKDFNNFL